MCEEIGRASCKSRLSFKHGSQGDGGSRQVSVGRRPGKRRQQRRRRSSGGSGGSGAGVDGLKLGAQSRHTGGGAQAAPGRRRPWEQAAPVERSGVGRRVNPSGGDLKAWPSSTFKYIKGQSLEFNIAAAMGLELHHPIMSKLWGLRD